MGQPGSIPSDKLLTGGTALCWSPREGPARVVLLKSGQSVVSIWQSGPPSVPSVSDVLSGTGSHHVVFSKPSGLSPFLGETAVTPGERFNCWYRVNTDQSNRERETEGSVFRPLGPVKCEKVGTRADTLPDAAPRDAAECPSGPCSSWPGTAHP